MKELLAFAVVLLTTCVQADTFFGPSSVTNRFLVASNEVLLIHRFFPPPGQPDLIQVSHGGTIDTVRIRHEFSRLPQVIAGECELIVSNAAVVWFSRLRGTSEQTEYFARGEQPRSIEIPEDRRLRLQFTEANMTLTYPTGITINPLGVWERAVEIEGPATLSYSGGYSDASGFLTYSFVDSSQATQSHGLIQGPTGEFRVVVERSPNMTNWTTSAVIKLSDDQKQFYRFRIAK